MLDTLISLLGKPVDGTEFEDFIEKIIQESPESSIDLVTKEAWFYFNKSGITVGSEQHIVQVMLQYYQDEEMQPYKLNVSKDIGQGSTKASLLAMYGKPIREGEPNPKPLYPGDIPIHWILYNMGDYWIRFQFTIKTGQLEMVTLMTPESVPGNRPKDQEAMSKL